MDERVIEDVYADMPLTGTSLANRVLDMVSETACDLAAEYGSGIFATFKGGRMAFYPSPDYAAGYAGVGIVPEHHYLIYQENGFQTFPMKSLYGKAQPLSEPVLTPDGFKPMGEIEPGCLVIGSDGAPVKAIDVYDQGMCDVYDVEFTDGGHTRCTKEHLWSVRRNGAWVDDRVMPLEDFMGRIGRTHGDSWRIRLAPKIMFDKRDLPLHPYFVGAMIGDGCLRGPYPYFCCYDGAGIDTFMRFVPECVTPHAVAEDGARIALACGAPGYNAAPSRWGRGGNSTSPLIDAFRSLGLWGHDAYGKTIPEEYMLSCVEDRVLLLQGLMDTDGSCAARGAICQYTTVCRDLAVQVRSLALSLGGHAYIHEDRRSGKYRNGVAYIVEMRFDNGVVPFLAPYEKKLKRYLDNVAHQSAKCWCRRFKSVSFSGREECRCILVDSADGLYVTNDYIVTHNTVPMVIGGQLVFRKVTNINQWRKGEKTYWVRGQDGELMPETRQSRSWVHPGHGPVQFIADAIDDAIAMHSEDIDYAFVGGMMEWIDE